MPLRRRTIYWQVSGPVGHPFSFLVGGLASRPAKRPAGHVERSSLEQHRAEDGIEQASWMTRAARYSTVCTKATSSTVQYNTVHFFIVYSTVCAQNGQRQMYSTASESRSSQQVAVSCLAGWFIGDSTSSDLKCKNEQIFLSRNQMYSTFYINCHVKQTLASVQ